jgi:hypothetical protein
MPDEPRSTALDPDLLTAEVGILLDFLSGLPERILTVRVRQTGTNRAVPT